jgi:hypothetical protein
MLRITDARRELTTITAPSHASKIITERLNPNTKPQATPKRDMLQSFIDHGLRGEALKQEVGIQL